MAKYICTKPCWYGKHLFRLGEVAEFDEDYPKDIKGDLCHFRKIDGRKKESIPTIDEDAEITVKVNRKKRKAG